MPTPEALRDPKALADETCERAMMGLEAEADALMAEAPEFGVAIRSLANLAPPPFRNRAAAQIDALIRQAMCDAFYRGFNAHKDLAAVRSADDPDEGKGDVLVSGRLLTKLAGATGRWSGVSSMKHAALLADAATALWSDAYDRAQGAVPPVLKREESRR